MSDHEKYCITSVANEIHIEDAIEDMENLSDDVESIIDTQTSNDDFLIELYRERPFLYDKRNSNFKDTLMKQNAWNEISKTMIQTNCGDLYTPEHC
ncbi:uncharacterized protein LOC112588710 [Harpegnathos saltator]|uniref:uncharacterized protein LOC112588710 n=1 Tax=Harpegnathos saltator TaxID=610380 RepID=UPI000DBEDE63|nr:uncharacterized protein LOC112588710 [Harpegnathos saltator]